MLQILQNNKTGEVTLEEIAVPKVRSGCLLVKNAFSVLSLGTERMKVSVGKKSLIGKAKERPDQVKQVLDHVKRAGLIDTYKRVMNRLDQLTPLGYSSTGEIVEVGDGVSGLKVGDKVACGGFGHAEYIAVPKNLCALVPENVNLETAAFTTLGAIALHGIRQSEARIGDNVVVVGLGLVGQIVTRILSAGGCGVVGIDLSDNKLELAREGRADLVIGRAESSLIQRILDFSNGHGVDAVIITAGTSSNDPIELAPKILRDRGIVVMLGISKMDIPWREYYEKEIDVRLSRSYGPGRYDPVYEKKGIDYPIGYVRWTQKRNMEAFLELLAKGRINLEEIITHKYPFSEAEKVYENLDSGDMDQSLGILFEYRPKEVITRIQRSGQKRKRKDKATKINVGLIGAGNYARNTILPIISKMDFLELKGISTATGISAKDIQKKYQFTYSTTDANEILEDSEIDTILISTQHDTHATFAAEALRNDKNVFVEKPLAISPEELEEVTNSVASSKGMLMVGFNRRFSPLVKQMKNSFLDRQAPLAINYRVNAGMIPVNHWYQDPEKGGGRIIGEGCHFVDLVQFITGEKPVRVYAETITSENRSLMNDDSVNLIIKLSNGSIATINYIACGDSTYPKERLEVLGENSIAVLDDFKFLEIVKNGKRKVIRNRGQDKGHKAEFEAFFGSLLRNGESPITFEEMRLATLVTFAAVESSNKGTPICL
jgi:polar amino acid transport system substrate-binding protein